MTRQLCGRCLHTRESHVETNGHLMYCSTCMKFCDKDEYLTDHKPSDIATIMRIGVLKQ